MKKYLILAVLLLCVMTATAQAERISRNWDLQSYNVSITHGGITKEYTSYIDLKINFLERKIIIYSQDLQIIDYIEYRKYKDKDGDIIIEGEGTGTNYQNVKIDIILTKDSSFILIGLYYYGENTGYTYSCRFI